MYNNDDTTYVSSTCILEFFTNILHFAKEKSYLAPRIMYEDKYLEWYL